MGLAGSYLRLVTLIWLISNLNFLRIANGFARIESRFSKICFIAQNARKAIEFEPDKPQEDLRSVNGSLRTVIGLSKATGKNF